MPLACVSQGYVAYTIHTYSTHTFFFHSVFHTVATPSIVNIHAAFGWLCWQHLPKCEQALPGDWQNLRESYANFADILVCQKELSSHIGVSGSSAFAFHP